MKIHSWWCSMTGRCHDVFYIPASRFHPLPDINWTTMRDESHNHFRFHLIQDCVLYAVGKPVYFKSTEQNYGAWLRDPLARNDITAERIWMTKENDGFQLFEYANKAAYRNNLASKVYRMQFPFKVTVTQETKVALNIHSTGELFCFRATHM